MSKSDIEAFTWVRQATDNENSRYALGGVCFEPKYYSITATNGVAILRAELDPNFSELLAKALKITDDEQRILYSSGKLSWSWELNNTVTKLNEENISICGNNFRISTDRYQNLSSFFDSIPKYERPSKGYVPLVDPHYAAMFFPKRTKNSSAACSNPPVVKIHCEDTWERFRHPIYFQTYDLSFTAYGFIMPFAFT